MTGRRGRGAFAPEAWLATAPLAVGLLPLSEPGALTSPVTFVGWLVVGAAAWAAFGAVIAIAGLLTRGWPHLPTAAILAVGGTAGVARSTVIGLLAPLLGSASGTLATRSLTGLVLGAAWALLASAALDGLADYRARRDALLEQYADMAHPGAATTTPAREVSRDVAAELEGPVLEALRALARDDPRDAADVVQHLAIDHVRPASHRMSSASPAAEPPPPTATELMTVLVRIDISVTLTLCGLVALVSGPIIARTYGLAVAVTGLAAFSAVAVAVSVFIPPARGRRPWAGLTAWLLGVLAAAATGAAAMVLTGMPTPAAVGWALAALVGFPAIAGILAIALAAPEIRALRLATIEDAVGRRHLEAFAAAREAERVRVRAAEYLHSTVQARLLASAAALRLADSTGDRELRDEAKRAAADALHGWERAVARSGDQAGLDGLRQQWCGLMDVSLSGNEVMSALPQGVRHAVLAVAAEATANAARHGRAGRVDITVQAEAGRVTLSVSDDGTYSDGPNGLGTRLLDRHARGHWRRRRNERGGCDLVAVLPDPGTPRSVEPDAPYSEA